MSKSSDRFVDEDLLMNIKFLAKELISSSAPPVSLMEELEDKLWAYRYNAMLHNTDTEIK